MIGTTGTMKHYRTQIHNVPLLFCPVCQHAIVHYLVESEFEILTEYAYADGAEQLDFNEFVDEQHLKHLNESCVNHEEEEPLDVIRNQIDLALDLLLFAKQLKDKEWEQALKQRLRVFSQRKRIYSKEKALDT